MRFPEDRVILDNLRNKNDTSEHMEFMFTFSDDILLPYYKLNFSFSPLDADEKAIEKMLVYPDVEEDYRNNMEIIETEDKFIHYVGIERDQYEEVSYHLTGVIEAKEVAQMIYYDAKITIPETESPFPDTVLEEMNDKILKQLESIQFTKEK